MRNAATNLLGGPSGEFDADGESDRRSLPSIGPAHLPKGTMPSQSDKQEERLAQRRAGAPSLKGYKKPGSMNRKKTFPIGRPKDKRR